MEHEYISHNCRITIGMNPMLHKFKELNIIKNQNSEYYTLKVNQSKLDCFITQAEFLKHWNFLNHLFFHNSHF